MITKKNKKRPRQKSCKCKKNPAVTLNSEVPRSLQVVFSAGFFFPFLFKLILPPAKALKARNQHNLHVWFSIRQVIRQQASQSRKHTNKLDTRIQYTLSHTRSLAPSNTGRTNVREWSSLLWETYLHKRRELVTETAAVVFILAKTKKVSTCRRAAEFWDSQDLATKQNLQTHRTWQPSRSFRLTGLGNRNRREEPHARTEGRIKSLNLKGPKWCKSHFVNELLWEKVHLLPAC